MSLLKDALLLEVRDLAKVAIWYGLNRHRQGSKKNIWVFGSRRSGTTLVAQVIGANAGLKVCDQPFAIASSTALQLRYIFEFDNGHALDLLPAERQMCLDYVNLIRDGRLHVGEPWRVWASNFHFRSDRLIFKETNGACLAPLMHETYGDHTLVLFRHPIPQSISCLRNGWELNYRPFLGSKWYVETYLGDALEGFCWDILRSDRTLDKYVLVWCLENRPLHGYLSEYPQWGFVSYERFVEDTAAVIDAWSRSYDLPQLDAMLQAARQPSVSTRKLSTAAAKSAIRNADKANVLFAWRSRIAAEDERRLMAIVERFGIDEYKPFETTSKIGFRAPAAALEGTARGGSSGRAASGIGEEAASLPQAT
ncbi:MAG: hypothetical protein JNM48_07045 [Rhodospirillales bacterium]|nr:hypothetical protein [Rhodospirillales bacterium]